MISKARGLFAERGFYGVSIAQIAAELGLTKQALLHHFGTKEKLYGEVLQGVSQELNARLSEAAKAPAGSGADRLSTTFLELIPRGSAEIERTRLLVRELLDNRRRAADSGTWYLADFLGGLTALLRECEGWAEVSDAEARATLFQWLGAIEYTVVARPTLRGIYGEDGSADLWAIFPQRLAALIASDLARGPLA